MGIDGQRELAPVLAERLEPLEHLRSAPHRNVVVVDQRILLVFLHFFRVLVYVSRHHLWYDLEVGHGRRQHAAEDGLDAQHRRPLHVEQRRAQEESRIARLVFQTRERRNEAPETVPCDEHRRRLSRVLSGRRREGVEVEDQRLQVDDGACATRRAMPHRVVIVHGDARRRQSLERRPVPVSVLTESVVEDQAPGERTIERGARVSE